MYWSKLTTRGAMVGGWLGLLTAVVLMILGPTIWVQVLGHATPVYPYEYPALFSMLVAFVGTGCFPLPIIPSRGAGAGEIPRTVYPFTDGRRDFAGESALRLKQCGD